MARRAREELHAMFERDFVAMRKQDDDLDGNTKPSGKRGQAGIE
ncbi:hypothetical protein [Massilia sp. BSC265]|nr:hypothetical protein [Massilia sp. BSC265]